jgi:hypothetical protein
LNTTTTFAALIIDCAAYAIGGAAIHERIILQNLPELQQFYPEQTWTPDRVRRLFESNGLLEAIAIDRTRGSRLEDQYDRQSGQAKFHSDQIELLLTRIDNICKKIRAEQRQSVPKEAVPLPRDT